MYFIFRRQIAKKQKQLMRALSSNQYFIWVLQLIVRCKQYLLYSSCDLVDIEVAREGVEYEDEVQFSPKPLVDHRLKSIRKLSLQEKQNIFEYLCFLGHKVTCSGDDLGIEQQMECPLIVYFDKSAPLDVNAKLYGWKTYKISEYLNIASCSSKDYIASLRALSVVTDAKAFKEFDELIFLVEERQLAIDCITSNLYCLWALELLTHAYTSFSSRQCLHVDHHLLASGGVGTVDETESEEIAHLLYGDPLFFSRVSKLELMTATCKRVLVHLLKAVGGWWEITHNATGVRDAGSQCDEYLFTAKKQKYCR